LARKSVAYVRNVGLHISGGVARKDQEFWSLRNKVAKFVWKIAKIFSILCRMRSRFAQLENWKEVVVLAARIQNEAGPTDEL